MKNIKLSRKKALATAVYVILLGHFLFSNIFFTLGPALLVHNSPESACVPSEKTSCDIHCPVMTGSSLDFAKPDESTNIPSTTRTKGFPLAWRWEDPERLGACGWPVAEDPPMATPINLAYMIVLTVVCISYLQRPLAKKTKHPKDSPSKTSP